MGSISKTLDRIEKITSIFSHLKNLLIVICVIVLLVVAWRAWKWMEATNTQIPNTQQVMDRVSEVKDRLGEVELPKLPDTTIVGEKYDEVKEKAGQILSYRPDWLSSDGSAKEGAEGQKDTTASEQIHTPEKAADAPVTNEEEINANQTQNNPEPAVQSAQPAQEDEKQTFASRLGQMGESIGGVIDQVDQGVQSAQEKVDPLLDRAGELVSGWTGKDTASDSKPQPETQEPAEKERTEETTTANP